MLNMKRHDGDALRRDSLTQQVAQALRGRINPHRSPDEVSPPGEYGPGDRLPTERQLLDEFAPISRTTIRAAIDVLAGEGLIRKEQGRGTFVCHPTVRWRFGTYTHQDQGPGRGLWDLECAAQGVNGWTRMVRVDQWEADEEIARGLAVPVGTPVVRRLQYMHVDTDVIRIKECYLPLELVEGTELAGSLKVTGGVYRALERIGHVPVRTTEGVLTRPATFDETTVFGVPGAQVLQVIRRTYNSEDRCIEMSRSVNLGDRTELVYENLDPLGKSS